MTDKAKLRLETKKHIRGLIMSSPGLTIGELKNDYENFIGQPIPFRQLGFARLEDFLEDISDTVCTSYERGMLVLRSPSNPLTNHIEKLVARQKIPNKKKWAVLRKPPPKRNSYRPPPVVPSQLRYQIQELFKSFSDGLPMTHFEACFSKRFGFQLDYKKLRFSTLSQLLESIPAVVKIAPFQNGEWRVLPAKSNSAPKPLPRTTPSQKPQSRTESNHTSTSTIKADQTSSKPKPVPPQTTVRPQVQKPTTFQTPSTIPSLLNIHVEDPHQSQHFQSPQMRLIQAGNMVFQVPVMPNVYVPTSSLQYLPPNMGHQMQASNVQNQSQMTSMQQQAAPSMQQAAASYQQPQTTAQQPSQVNYQSPPEDKPQSQGRQRQPSGFSATSGNSGQSFDSNEFLFDDDSGIPSELQEEIREVLAQRPKGIWASRLLFEYKDKFKKELPFKDYGFHSVVEFVSTLPQDLVTIQRPNKKGDWILFDARLQRGGGEGTENVSPTSRRESQNPRENKAFRESVRQVLQLYPEGILMQEFPDKYKEMTGKTLKEEIRFCGSLEKLCISLTDDVLQINYKGDGCLMLHAIHSDVSRKFDKLLEHYQPLGTSHIETSEDDQLPADVVGPGTYYSQISLPDHRDYIEIYVSNIVSPGVFWIQFRHKNHTMALEKLMDDLEFYKTSAGDCYKLPPSLIAVGQVVAVVFPEDDNWHRGIITSIRTLDFVDVYYVDYGNTCSVHKKNLRLLRSRFLKLPAQAVQARLANIQPIGGKWTEQSKGEMLKICVNKPVIAFVTDLKNRVLSICLTDTSADVDLHLNDHLVSEGFAEFAPDELQPTNVYPGAMREIPDDSLIYGISSQQDDLVAQAALSMASANQITASQGDNTGYPSSSEGGCQRFIHPVDLTPDTYIHVINLDREPWLISAEISALFWEEDVLRSKLQSKRLLVKKQVLSQTEQPALFHELLYYGVKSVDESKTFVTIYSLKGLPSILEQFQHPNLEMKARVEEILQEFDPDDLYWQGEDSDMAADIQRELEETQLGVDELKLTLQALQFKRKRILQSLLSESGSEADYVNQLAEVELQISKTKELMEEVEATLGCEVTDNGELMEEVEATLGCEVTDNESDVKSCPVSSINSPEKSIKTNVVAPLIVRNREDSVSSAESYQPNTPASTNQNQAMQSHDQMLRMMMTAQANMTTFDPSVYGMMMPMMQNSMAPLPSLGRGQPINMQQKGEGQALPMPRMPMFNPGNQSSNNNLPGIPNLTSMQGGILPNQGLQDIQNFMPNYQAMMAANNQMSLLQNMGQMANVSQLGNPRLHGPNTVSSFPNMQGVVNMPQVSMANSSLGNMQGMMGMGQSGHDMNTPQNVALLPELLPLLNNLSINNNQSQSKN